MYKYLVVLFFITTSHVYCQESIAVNMSTLTAGVQTADGRADFPYTADSTKQAAGKILAYQDNLKQSISKHVEELRQTYSGADPDTLSSLITCCSSSIPADNSQSLLEQIRVDLSAIQEIDGRMYAINKACTSLRTPQDESCKADMKSAEDELAEITSAQELGDLDAKSQVAIEETTIYLTDCVAKGL